MNFDPTSPVAGGPASMSHEDGASTDVIGRDVCSMAEITETKGSRGGPWKENPGGGKGGVWLEGGKGKERGKGRKGGKDTEDSVYDVVG